ncbi:hypothetical protein ASA01S_130_00030 [Aeromonas salmonicida subsp. masoucida NBRC 13784]|nr:hypothetical protein ASA01S_130_00030 [Aeromonas salmonicida subsp. masoucida NBRC 13784]
MPNGISNADNDINLPNLDVLFLAFAVIVFVLPVILPLISFNSLFFSCGSIFLINDSKKIHS